MHLSIFSRNAAPRSASWPRWLPGGAAGTLAFALALVLPLCAAPPSQAPGSASDPIAGVNGGRALAFARAATAFGPRPSGSPAIEGLRRYIIGELRGNGIPVEEQRFTARTPAGDVPMVNLIAKIPGNSRRRILLTGHYDTKRFQGIQFVGANDGASSTALLLELATVLSKRKAAAGSRPEIWFVFFDGEEAVGDWSETDSLYGSRHLASRMEREGQLRSIRALINLDMIGDRDLNLALEYNSSPALRDLAVEVAAAQGHPDLFDRHLSAIEDDHIPFAKLKVPVLNLIDFAYGPRHAWWHSEDDTIDKLSPASFRIVGNLVLGIVERLNR